MKEATEINYKKWLDDGRTLGYFDRIALGDADSITKKSIKQGLSNANNAWKSEATKKLHDTCSQKPEFTMNDVRDRVQSKTHDNRAWGGIIKEAQKLGWIEPTGREIKSIVGHKTPLQIWKSNLYKNPETLF